MTMVGLQRIVPFGEVLTVAHLPTDGSWPVVYATRVDWVPSPGRGWYARRHNNQPEPGSTRCGASLADQPWIAWPDDEIPTCPRCLGVLDVQDALL